MEAVDLQIVVGLCCCWDKSLINIAQYTPFPIDIYMLLCVYSSHENNLGKSRLVLLCVVNIGNICVFSIGRYRKRAKLSIYSGSDWKSYIYIYICICMWGQHELMRMKFKLIRLLTMSYKCRICFTLISDLRHIRTGRARTPSPGRPAPPDHDQDMK